jgi:uncharacterized membrane protein
MEKLLKKTAWLVTLVPAAYLALVWNSLPASIPMHFNLEGNADRYGSRYGLLTMMLILTAVSLAVYFFMPQIYRK